MRWHSFIRRREALKREGIAEREATEQAMRECLEEWQDDPDTVIHERAIAPGMVPAATFEDKNCSIHDAIRWVLGQLRMTVVKPETCPSAAAWNILQWALESAANEDEFMKNHVLKLMPTRKQLDREEKYNDDSASLLKLIAQVRESAIRNPDASRFPGA